MIEKFTIMRTRRWGNDHTEVSTAAVLMRNKASADQARILANEMIEKEPVGTNVELEFEVLHANTEQLKKSTVPYIQRMLNHK